MPGGDDVFDPEIDVVRVYRRAGQGCAPVAELSLDAADVLTMPLLPDLVLPLADLFREAR